MAQQLDLFNASRTTSYRNQHRVIQRRLNQALTSARRSVRSVKLILRRSGIKVKRSSFGSKGG